MKHELFHFQPVTNCSIKYVHEALFSIFRYVSDHMGGPIEKGELANFSYELPISQIRYEMKSNVVPIGKIKTGIHIHRALLFKVYSFIRR